MSAKAIEVFIGESQPIFLNGLRLAFESFTDELPLSIKGTFQKGSELLQALRQPVDLVITDLDFPDMNGLDLMDALRCEKPASRIIILSNYSDVKVVKTMFRCGVDGYLHKRCQPGELKRAIVAVMQGEAYLGEGLSLTRDSGTYSTIIQDGKLSPSYEQLFIKKYKLTQREIEVLKLIGMAKTNKEIGEELFISDQTVGVHRKNIMRKLGVNSTANLIRFVFEHNLV